MCVRRQIRRRRACRGVEVSLIHHPVHILLLGRQLPGLHDFGDNLHVIPVKRRPGFEMFLQCRVSPVIE